VKHQNKYCLNYAGCKGQGLEFTFAIPLKYCLNYAGCKDNTPYQEYIDRGCIALTMRDVKKVIKRARDFQFRYCLNYAGCKAALEICREKLMAGIALTMRDVKRKLKEAIEVLSKVLP